MPLVAVSGDDTMKLTKKLTREECKEVKSKKLIPELVLRRVKWSRLFLDCLGRSFALESE